MGQEGAKVLLDLIANPEKSYPQEIVMQPLLIKRESTGRAATAKKRRTS